MQSTSDAVSVSVWIHEKRMELYRSPTATPNPRPVLDDLFVFGLAYGPPAPRAYIKSEGDTGLARFWHAADGSTVQKPAAASLQLDDFDIMEDS